MGKGNAEYARIPIIGAARRCGVRINDNTIRRTEVEAACPFCGDKPGRYHLYLSTDKDQYHCMLCGAGGNSVSLYARLHNVSYAEAAGDLINLGNIYPMPLPPRSANPPECGIKPLPERHVVYNDMLEHLTLSDKHLSDLRRRGLSDERIAYNMYRTLPDGDQGRRFLAGILAGFRDLSGVPGFHTDNNGCWTISGKGGLLIPVRDANRRIQGLQIRLDDTTMGESQRRYRWLSSRYMACGTRSGNWIHVTGNVSSKMAYLTEGPLKGDVASFHDDDALFICIAGVNSTNGLTDVIRSLGATEVILAADMDKVTNRQVREGFEKIAGIVSRIGGVSVRSLDWDVCFKGIDDYYRIRHRGSMDGKVMDTSRNGITEYVQSLWEKEYPKQSSVWIGSCEWEEAIVPLSELSFDKPRDPEKAREYRRRLEAGEQFPPVIAVNGIVIDGLHRCRAYAESGTEFIRVYKNKPVAVPEAA